MFFQINSPDTSVASWAYLVDPSGDVGGHIIVDYLDVSYGRVQSPGTSYADLACCVRPAGAVDCYYYIGNSYGRRPAFVLPGSIYVDDSGNVVTNEVA